MPKKSMDLNVIVPILVGIIVLLGVYIIVNNKKQVSFAVPEVTEEIIYQPDYRSEPVVFGPSYFNPNYTREPFNVSDFIPGINQNISIFGTSSLPPAPSDKSSPSIDNPSISSPSIGNPSIGNPSIGNPSTMPSMNISSQQVQMAIPTPMESAPDNASTI